MIHSIGTLKLRLLKWLAESTSIEVIESVHTGQLVLLKYAHLSVVLV